MTPGATNSIADIAGLKVGHGTDQSLKSGVTVLVADVPFTASVATMGGAPGTRETDLLQPDKSVAQVDALVLSGGSAFGLDACSGVVAGLYDQGRGFQVGEARVPIVPGAILFDLLSGGEKDWDQNPYAALGRAAMQAASTHVDLGSVGAGTGAMTATLKGGLGTASFLLPSGHTVAALVAANPVGAVVSPGERHFWAAPFEYKTEFGGHGPDPKGMVGLALPPSKFATASDHANTTLAIVATDAKLDKAQCQRMAWAAQAGISRAAIPAQTPADGDLVFAVSHGERPMIDGKDFALICHVASLCVTRAIARGVYHATPYPDDLLPTWSERNAET